MVGTELRNYCSWSGKVIRKELHLHFFAVGIGNVHHMHELA
jgi:hypothetical protein